MTRPRHSSRIDADDQQSTRATPDGGRSNQTNPAGSSTMLMAIILIMAGITAAIALGVVLPALGFVPVAEYLRPAENIRHAASRVLLVGGLIGLLVSLIAKWTD